MLVPLDSALQFYVREDEFTFATYPQHCPVEFSLPVWDEGGVVVVSLLIRLAGRHAASFDRWLNPGDPPGLRLLQLLSTQRWLDLWLVSDRVQRSFRRPNRLAGKAAGLVAMLRTRRSWTTEEFEVRRKRLDTLYPTAPDLWRAARHLER